MFYRVVGGLLLMAAAVAVQAKGVVVNDPWVRAAPPNAPALAAFMQLENHSATDVALVEVRTTLPVSRVELHRTMMADGMMKMVQQQEMPVAAHGSLVLKPGSWHIMLIAPRKVPVEGDQVSLTLRFSDGSEQQVTAQVRKGAMMKGGHQMMHH
jgi:copper(I)-binding protein